MEPVGERAGSLDESLARGQVSGALATSCQAFQYFPSSELRPVSPGSASESSTCSRPSLFAS